MTSTNELKVTDHWHEVFRDISGCEFNPDPLDDLEDVIKEVEQQISDLDDKISRLIQTDSGGQAALMTFNRACMQFDSDWFRAEQIVSEWVEDGDEDNVPEGTFGYLTVVGEDIELSANCNDAVVSCYVEMSNALGLEYNVDEHIYWGILSGARPTDDVFDMLWQLFGPLWSELAYQVSNNLSEYHRSLTNNLEKLINVKSKLEFELYLARRGKVHVLQNTIQQQ